MKKPDSGSGRTLGAIVLAAILLSLASGGCSLFKPQGDPPPALRVDFSRVPPEGFPAKIKELEGIAELDANPAVRARAFFYIALGCMHYNNLTPDYAKSVLYLDRYIALSPNDKDIDQVVAWKSVASSLDRSLREYEKLQKDYAQLKQQYDAANKNNQLLARKVNDLGQVIEKQKKEMDGLKETIKKLDAVEQEIEKKRKGIKK